MKRGVRLGHPMWTIGDAIVQIGQRLLIAEPARLGTERLQKRHQGVGFLPVALQVMAIIYLNARFAAALKQEAFHLCLALGRRQPGEREEVITFEPGARRLEHGAPLFIDQP